MDDKVSIRNAYIDDAEAMAELLSELFTIEDDFAIDRQKQLHALHLLLQDPDATLVVAEISGRVIGMVSMQSLISTVSGGKVGLIEDMIITADFRCKGIGRLLLNAMIEASIQLGYRRLSLGADRRNDPALAFYRTFGFETSNMGLIYRTIE